MHERAASTVPPQTGRSAVTWSRRDALRLAATGFAAAYVQSGHASLSQSGARLPLVGINLACAEFGQNVPGVFGVDYTYPTATEVAYFARLGFTCIRVPFLWERLQPHLTSPLDRDEADRLSVLVREIEAQGLTAILDPHNYARRRIAADNWSSEHLIGSAKLPIAAFADFWGRVAERYRTSRRVAFGLMNEPHDLTPTEWLTIANLGIEAIRSSGAGQLVLVPGTSWTGAHSWIEKGNTIMNCVLDPAHNMAIEVHQYFDANSSGTSPETVSGSSGTERIAAFQAWARANGIKAFLGEFGAADTPAGLNALSDICQEMSANSDVWIGWSAWAAGPYWETDYVLNLEPMPDGAPRRQTELLARFARREPDVWVRAAATVDLDLARERVFGCRDFTDVLVFDDLRLSKTAQAGNIKLRGRLLELANAPAFTLLIELDRSDVPESAGAVLYDGTGMSLLSRHASGAVVSSLHETLRTGALTQDAWRSRRRCALAADRSRGMATIAVTGARSVERPVELNEFLELHVSSPARSRVVRITAYDRYLNGAELDAILA